jgi:hypothetical protein
MGHGGYVGLHPAIVQCDSAQRRSRAILPGTPGSD